MRQTLRLAPLRLKFSPVFRLFSRAPLALKLTLGFALVSALASAALGFALLDQASEALELETKTVHLGVTDSMARKVNETVTQSRTALNAISRSLDDKTLSIGAKLEVARSLVSATAIDSLAIYDESGKLLDVIGPGDLGVPFKDHRALGPAAIRTIPCHDAACLELDRPWSGGMLVARADVASLGVLISELSLRRFASAEDRIGLFSQDGLRIAGPSSLKPGPGNDALFMQDAAVSRRQLDENAEPVLRTYAAIPSLRWVVAVDQPLTIALAVQKRMRDRIFLVVGLATLVALIVSLLIARRQTAPLRRLADAAKQVAAGDFSVRVDASGGDEVAELSRAFNEMASELSKITKLQDSLRRSENMAAIGTLVSGVAHEVRNPLFVIIAGLDGLGMELGKNSPYEDYLLAIRNNADRLTQLMNDLLDFARPHNEPMVVADLCRVVRAAKGACLTLAKDANVEIELTLPEQELMIPMREHRLHQVFQNLIQNAVQFSPSGSRVSVVTHIEQDEAVTQIFDFGPGLKPADTAKLFQPFFTRRAGGTGLGLSIVKKIVEDHQGAITLQNHEKGAVSTVRLPLRKT